MIAVSAAVRLGRKKFIILDYGVPGSISNIGPGWGIICPLRGKSYDGIVLSVKECPDEEPLKFIEGVVGAGPIVPPDLIRLVYWVSDNCLVDLSSAVGLVFPTFARGQWVDMCEIAASEEDLKPLISLHPEAAEAVSYILAKKHFSPRALETRFGKELASFCLNWLREAGFILEDRHFTTDRHLRLKGNMVSLRLKDPEAFISKNKRAFKQVAVVTTLLSHGGEYPLESLMKETGAGKAILKELEKKKAVSVYNFYEPWDEDGNVQLTGEQDKSIAAVVEKLEAGENKVFLLHGVTGSGKTEVYVKAAEFASLRKKQVIVIVPEIALSSQVIRYFQRSFGLRAVILHSKLSSAERYQTWKRIRSGDVDVVIGTRSAVFAPFSNLGLIIIDEEHDKSLKQDTNPRYHCREVARERCRQNNAVLLLGSATPSLESLFLAETGQVERLEMLRRVSGNPPRIKVVDMRRELQQGNSGILSLEVQDSIQDSLAREEQVIAFLNRRGYAAFVSCRNCGFVFRCDHCDISLTYHAKNGFLKCHYCGYATKAAFSCPVCGSRRMKTFGLGTEKLEEALRVRFPEGRIIRLDSDSTVRPGTHDKIVGSFMRGDYDILVGTQMVTKGFDFPAVTLVCVIAADMDLNLPDFRAEERTFQLLSQVAGRAGRRHKPGTVIIQTYSPHRPGVSFLEQDRQKDFFMGELRRRRELDYPPYSRFVRLLFSAKKEGDALKSADRLASKFALAAIPYLGPAPAPIEKVRDLYRWHMIIRDFCPDYKGVLLKLLEEEREHSANKVKIVIDVDPQSLM